MSDLTNKKYDILIVEDDAPSRLFLKTLIKVRAKNIYSAVDGIEGLELFSKHRPQIVLSDLGMPEMNGLEMSRRIREIDPKAQIVLITAFDNRDFLLQAIDIGINQYILKPLQKEPLNNALDRIYSFLELESKVNAQYESIKSLSSAIEQSSSMVVISNEKGNIEFVNNQFADFYGCDPENLANTSITELLNSGNNNEEYSDYIDAFRNFRGWKGEVFVTAGDTDYWLLVSLSPVADASGRITRFVQVMEDITLQKKEEEELIKSRDLLEKKVNERTKELIAAKEQAESANKAKGLFLAKVSHELRTPLNGIIGVSSILKDASDDHKQKKFIEIISNSAYNLLNIINDILDFSSIEAGKLTISHEAFSLSELLGNIEALIKPQADSKMLDFRVKKNISDDAWYISDSKRIQQVIINLLSNALKFTDKGKVILEVKSLMEEHDKELLRFEVSDTGIGIPETKRQMLFKSFSQADDSMTRKYGGTGLGLVISKEIVESLGGRIDFKSESGKGSTFFFDLPINKSVGENANQEDLLSRQTAAEKANKQEEYRLLVAEDSFINKEVIKEILKNNGFKVDFAVNGLQAYDLATENKYDLIIMDVQMPFMDGIESTGKLRAAGIKIPIIGLTAFISKDLNEDCIKAGMNIVMPKPVEWDSLINEINKLIRERNNNLDLDKLFFSINYNMELFKKVTNYFLNNYADSLKKIANAIENNDDKELKAASHKLKSEISNFRANQAMELLGKIELAAKAKDFIKADEQFKKAVIEIENIAAKLSENNKIIR
ncbi:MAG: response regulator [Candidatus Kapaibacterium sp.]